MLLTKRNEYALQAMILLARQKEGELIPASTLALALKTTPAFMSKIAQQLSGAGLLRSRKGKNGGLFLGLRLETTYLEARRWQPSWSPRLVSAAPRRDARRTASVPAGAPPRWLKRR